MDKIPNHVDLAFRIYGDNILECLILIDWLNQSVQSKLQNIGKTGAVDREIYIYKSLEGNTTYAFQLCPYFGGKGINHHWKNDQRTKYFSEKPDVIVTRVFNNDKESKPIFAIEFCDALQAGNQSWQRFRRAYDAAVNGIPYFYVLPIIGWERDSGGMELKGARYQNAQITLAQLSLSSKLGVPSLQIYTKTSWVQLAEKESKPLPDDVDEIANINNAVEYIGTIIRYTEKEGVDNFTEIASSLEPIFQNMFQVAKRYGEYKNTKFVLHTNRPVFNSDDDIKNAAKEYSIFVAHSKSVKGKYALHNINGSDLQKHGALFFKDAQTRTTSHNFRTNILFWLNWKNSYPINTRQSYLIRWGINFDNNETDLNRVAIENRDKIPVTYKEGKSEAVFIQNRLVMRDIVKNAYPSVSQNILNWINNNEDYRPLLVVPFYAYKPSGDSRPDRGLLPNLTALFPDLTSNRNILVLVYSIHTPENWKDLFIQGGNELWNVIRALAGAVIVDKTGDGFLITDDEIKT